MRCRHHRPPGYKSVRGTIADGLGRVLAPSPSVVGDAQGLASRSGWASSPTLDGEARGLSA